MPCSTRGKKDLGDYCEKCIPLEIRYICDEQDNSDWAPHNIDKFPVQYNDEENEKEAPP